MNSTPTAEPVVASSGESAGQTLTIDMNGIALAAAGNLQVSFVRMSPDASPGWNTLHIHGLPPGTRGVSAWITEWAPGDRPHAGGAWFVTNSVQLFDNGRQCRVSFHSSWGSHLPAAAQLIYG